MAWSKGIQSHRMEYSARAINEEILERKGFIQEGEAKVLLCKFLRNNISLASEMIIGMKLFPFQAMLIKGMMIGDFSMFVLSRGMSKTWSAAIYVMLQLMFRQGINIGVLSSGFRQAKFILQKCEDILKKPAAAMASPLFTLQKGTDQWTLSCGMSKAMALPLADGSRLRGFRFSVLLLDEFLNIPKNIFQEVILPFLGVIDNPTEREDLAFLEDELIASGKMKEEDRYKWVNNKLIMLSSPSYTFEYMYELYCQYRDAILGVDIRTDENEQFDSDAYRIIFQLSYDCAPKALYDKNQLQVAKQTMSEAIFNKEYGGQFVSESDSYFKLSKMAACTVPDGDAPFVQIAGNPDRKYVVAIDPSWSEDRGSDDFAMEVFELDESSQKGCLVHAYGLAGTGLKKHIQYFHYLISNFNVQCVVLDYAGGVQFVSACNESELFKDNKIHLSAIETEGEFDKPETYVKDLNTFKRELAPTQHKYCIFRKPSSNWIRQANELLQANIDHKRILFAAPAHDENFNKQRKKNIPIEDLKWDTRVKKQSSGAAKIDFLDHQVSKIEQTKQQCANVEVVTNPQGSQTFRLPPHMSRQTGPNKPRKDNYSALVLGNWLIKTYFDAMNTEEEKQMFDTFTPFGA